MNTRETIRKASPVCFFTEPGFFSPKHRRSFIIMIMFILASFYAPEFICAVYREERRDAAENGFIKIE